MKKELSAFEGKKPHFINVLKKLGLRNNEAQIYFDLIKEGKKGETVYQLDHNLEHVLNRTTLYSILRKLIKMGCVIEAGQSRGSRKATVFIAVKFEDYLKKLIIQKQEEIGLYEEIIEKYSDHFNMIYLGGMEYHLDEVDNKVKPYLKPLIDKGWSIVSYLVKRDVPPFDYTVYDCMLHSPLSKILKENSFHVFSFKHEIEYDENLLNLFLEGLKKQTKEIITYYSDLENYIFEETKLNFFNREFPSTVLKVKLSDIEKSEYFPQEANDLIQFENLKPEEYVEVWKSVILPIKKDIFFLWAESYEILEEMVESIFVTLKVNT